MVALAGELEAGRRALGQSRWEAARLSFETVLEAGESAEARDGLGLALWFLGEVARGIDSKACAFELYARAGLADDAARTAVWVSHQHVVAGRLSAARGWLARAERMIADVGEGEGRGWVAVEKARQAARPQERTAYAQEAVQVARRVGASDLETLALSVMGRARVEEGRTEDGLRLLEEAMAGASGGRVRNVHTLAEAYCNLIMASAGAGDWATAAEWCEHVDAFARAHDTAPLYGSCRGVHAEVLLATGHWAQAEEALEASLSTHDRYVRGMGDSSVASLAELRIRQDRLLEAEALLAGREEKPSALRVLALLRLAQGRSGAAVAVLERGLRHHGGGAVSTGRLLGALVDARVSTGDLPAAEQSVRDLVELSEACDIRLVAAQADIAAAVVARVRDQHDAASELARRALDAYLSMAMPLEAAEARLELARSLADGTTAASGVLAEDEAQTALTVFRTLGAVRSERAAGALLHDVRGGGPGVDRRRGLLTPREQEVLELVARGFSNARIADSLTITEKTAGHHVSHILAKLGVHNRTEAAAHLRDQG